MDDKIFYVTVYIFQIHGSLRRSQSLTTRIRVSCMEIDAKFPL